MRSGTRDGGGDKVLLGGDRRKGRSGLEANPLEGDWSRGEREEQNLVKERCRGGGDMETVLGRDRGLDYFGGESPSIGLALKKLDKKGNQSGQTCCYDKEELS